MAKGVDIAGLVAEFRGQATRSCTGGSMHSADVHTGMLGANGIGTPAVVVGQIAAVSTGYGPVIIASQSQQNIGDVTVGIGGYATTDAVTGNVSNAIASLAKAWPGKNVTIVQAGVSEQVIESFISMPQAMLVAINLGYLILLGYLIMVILFRLLLVFLVIVCALQLAVFGAFVIVAVTAHERELSAFIVLLVLRGIVLTNAIVLLDLARHTVTKGRAALRPLLLQFWLLAGSLASI